MLRIDWQVAVITNICVHDMLKFVCKNCECSCYTCWSYA